MIQTSGLDEMTLLPDAKHSEKSKNSCLYFVTTIIDGATSDRS